MVKKTVLKRYLKINLFFSIEHHLQGKIIIESESNHRVRSSDAHVDHVFKCLVEVVADPAR